MTPSGRSRSAACSMSPAIPRPARRGSPAAPRARRSGPRGSRSGGSGRRGRAGPARGRPRRPRRTGAGSRWPRCTGPPRVSGVEQGAGDDADRIGEVHDPRFGGRCRTRSASSSTTGTVRSALARPPAPVVSCPTQQKSSGSVSSTLRAAWPPTRSWKSTASAPSTPSSTEEVVSTLPGCPCLARIRRETAPTASSRSAEGSTARPRDRQLVAQPGESVDEFRGVGRTAPDDCELHCAARLLSLAFLELCERRAERAVRALRAVTP